MSVPNASWAFKDPLELPALMAPKATKALMLDVATRAGHVLMVGERGIVLKCDAQGLNWTQAQVPVAVNLTGLAFASDHIVFAVGHDGVVLKSSDAGSTWIRVFDGNQANAQVLALAKAKLDAFQAKYDAASSTVQRTLDADLEAAQFAFEDAQAGAKFGPARPLLGVWFKDERQGWVLGSYGQIFETRDSGASWTLIADRLDNTDSRHYNALYGDSTGLLLVAGEAGRVYRSDNFGATWIRLDTGYNGHFYGTAVLRNGAAGATLFAYGFGGNVYRQRAGESAWVRLESASKDSFVRGLVVGNALVLVDQKGRFYTADADSIQLRMLQPPTDKLVTGVVALGNKWVLSGQGGPSTVDRPR